MNKNLLVAAVVVAAVAAIGVWYFLGRGGKEEVKMQPSVPSAPEVGVTVAPIKTAEEIKVEKQVVSQLVTEVVVEASKFKFEPNVIRVPKGKTIKLTFKSVDGMHDLVMDEFNVRTRQLNAGEENVVGFVADRTGTFEYYCSVADHRARGMVGTVIVE